jgi:peptide-methionine (S)-S-oxide reductase
MRMTTTRFSPSLMFHSMLVFAVGAVFAACSGAPSSAGPDPHSSSSAIAMAQNASAMSSTEASSPATTEPRSDGLQEATFGSGCFWCTEAYFDALEGVESVVSGYSGGFVKNPSYKEICTGRTGHAEVTRIVFDPERISFAELLEVFFATHDPTTLNRQGNDVGPQYRSVVFYHNEEQKAIAEASKAAADESGTWSNPVVTEISPLINWYPAEDYHQDYFANNPNQPYCAVVIRPKMDKFKARFAEKLKALK